MDCPFRSKHFSLGKESRNPTGGEGRFEGGECGFLRFVSKRRVVFLNLMFGVSDDQYDCNKFGILN